MAGRDRRGKFWLTVLTELKNRGLEDRLIACVNGFKGFPDAIAVDYPQPKVQQCFVRKSLRYVSWKDCKVVTAELKQIYQSAMEREAHRRSLTTFGERWDSEYTQIARFWQNHPPHPEVIYTTNEIESLKSGLRKATKQKKLS